MTTTILIFVILLRDRRRALALQRFFASFAHELRAPITSVILQADTLRGEPSGNLKGALFKRLLRQTRRLDDHLGQALRIARHIEGRPLSTEPLIVDDLLARFRKERRELLSGFRLHTQGPPHLQIWADAEGFLMILRNLIENTRRHSGLPEPAAELTWAVDERQVQFVFSDRGRGSPRHHRGQWPEPGDMSSGAGMGIFLIRSLCLGMGGSAHFHGRQGGFQVAFQLPRGHFSHD
jgi:signal transduction histidine kinase